MTERIAVIADEIRKLTPEERADLLDRLLVDGMQDDTVDAAWAAEAEARLDRYLRGETTAKDARDVLAKHLKK